MSVRCIEPPMPPQTPVVAAEQLGEGGLHVHAAGEAMAVAAIGVADVVVGRGAPWRRRPRPPPGRCRDASCRGRGPRGSCAAPAPRTRGSPPSCRNSSIRSSSVSGLAASLLPRRVGLLAPSARSIAALRSRTGPRSRRGISAIVAWHRAPGRSPALPAPRSSPFSKRRAVGDQRVEHRVAVGMKRFQIGAVGQPRRGDAPRSAAPRDGPSRRRRQSAMRGDAAPFGRPAAPARIEIADVDGARHHQVAAAGAADLALPGADRDAGLAARRGHVEAVVVASAPAPRTSGCCGRRRAGRTRPPGAASSPGWRRRSG